MRQYPRSIRRIFRRGGRRGFRRNRYIRRTGANAVRSRISRISRRRRPLRPEIKYLDLVQGYTPVVTASNTTTNISPVSVAVGPSEGQRIGDQIMARTLMVHFTLAVGVSVVLQPDNRPDDYVRVVLWTPRLDYQTASQPYMSGLTYDQIIDWNVVTVVKDFYQRLGYPLGGNFSTGTLTETSQFTLGNQPTIKHYTWSIPFPRKMKFPPSSVTGFTNLDVDKDIMYLTIYNSMSLSVLYSFTTRLTYTDA